MSRGGWCVDVSEMAFKGLEDTGVASGFVGPSALFGVDEPIPAVTHRPQPVPSKIEWIASEFLKVRVAHGYCSRHLAAGACPYANIRGTWSIDRTYRPVYARNPGWFAQEDLDEIARLLNTRLSDMLNWDTPVEHYNRLVAATA